MTIIDAILVAIVLASAGGLLAILRVYQVRAQPPPSPELVRKLFHISGGIIGLSLPWLFDSILPVLVLAMALTGTFASLRFVARLRGGVGQVLHGVSRKTVGEFCYLASIALLFWLSHGDRLLYSVPLLVLALADAFAALIGEQYGKLPLRMARGNKSYEGAAAFMLTAYFCVHVPVLLSGATGRLESLLVAAGVSVMVMMAEVAAWWGLDNLIIPLWTYLLLKALLVLDAAQLSADLAFLLVLALFMRFWGRRTTLGDDALFGATLWGFVVWEAGGWRWVIPPLVQLALSRARAAGIIVDPRRVYRFPVVLANSAGGMFWLLGYRQEAEPALILPFAACCGANIAIIELVHRHAAPGLPWRQAASASVAKGLLAVVPAVLLLDGVRPAALLDLAFGLLAVFTAAVVFSCLEPLRGPLPANAARWIWQAVAAAASSPIALGLHYGAMPYPANLGFVDLINLLSP
jgi:phytol kinase